ncbi:unnamed protein product, partial [Rotaria sp. Silwood1]
MSAFLTYEDDFQNYQNKPAKTTVIGTTSITTATKLTTIGPITPPTTPTKTTVIGTTSIT